MRLLGAIFIIISSAVIGIFKAKQLKTDVLTLQEIISFLEIIKNEISTRRTPLKLILRTKNLPEYKYISTFISNIEEDFKQINEKNFSEIWCGFADECFCGLDINCKQALCDLGNTLGRYGASEQASAIDRCIYLLSDEYEKLKNNLNGNQKMYIGMSTGIGLVLSIALV